MKITRHKDLREVSHAWAYAAGGEGGSNSNDSFSYTGGELFSYNTTIAKRIETKKGGEICLFNLGRYSVTTSNHQHLARLAFSGSRVVGAWEDAERGWDVFETQNIIKSHLWKLEKETENLANAKRESTRIKYTAAIGRIADNLKKLVEFDILKKSELPTQLKKLLKIEINQAGLESLKLAAKKALNKKLRAKKADILKSIEAFRNFERGYISGDARVFCGGDLVRINTLATGQGTFGLEKIIETSQGVTIPIHEALLLHKLVESHKAKKMAASYANKMLLDGKFKVESVDEKGNAKVGCHFFKYEEIKRCYEKEYLPTIKN